MLQPEFDRIGAGRDRKFIHETLDRKHVVIGAERPHRRNPHRHRRDEVMHHMGVGEFVDRDRVAVAAAFRQRKRLRRRHGERLRHVLGRQHRSGSARPHRMGVAPDLEIPVGDIAPLPSSDAFSLVTIAGPYGSQPCSCSRIHCTPNRHAGQFARDQRGVGGGIIGAVMAVAAGALDMDQADASPAARAAFRRCPARSG